ncbi:hypothetical protein EGR_09559 [Echinococcus granulosus]|uniref:Uncharacterized protein n=1 Tax=Echinococcus granulosus TaxID=6210 RepID=W6U396_ECHGR|nr:hypothetical protein EGR_09559 [Echinococcus granulosus]EUB55580.1 hypothetical protein EGR_09559 [Echinococcus granulosus]
MLRERGKDDEKEEEEEEKFERQIFVNKCDCLLFHSVLSLLGVVWMAVRWGDGMGQHLDKWVNGGLSQPSHRINRQARQQAFKQIDNGVGQLDEANERLNRKGNHPMQCIDMWLNNLILQISLS